MRPTSPLDDCFLKRLALTSNDMFLLVAIKSTLMVCFQVVGRDWAAFSNSVL